VLREWGRIGCIGFGGPPAHIALLRKLCVDQRGWLDSTEFEDAIAACNLLPGPASTELAIFCAWRVRGRLGALVGGAAFIVPGLIVILALSVLFLAGTPPPWVRGIGAGAGAAVAAVAVQAGWLLLVPSWRRAAGSRRPRWIAYLLAGAAAAPLIGPWLVFVLLGCGLTELTIRRESRPDAARESRPDPARDPRPGPSRDPEPDPSRESRPDPARDPRPGPARAVAAWPLLAVQAIRTAGPAAATQTAAKAAAKTAALAVGGGGLLAVAWVAFKVGALSFGGGFVIIPLMQADAVGHHWMTSDQFLNGVALGQITPGPVVLTVATVGYAAAGLGGGLLAALVAFTPSFAFILIGGRYFGALRGNRHAQAFLDGAGPAAIGAILGSAVALARALTEPWQYAVLAGAAVLLLALRRGVVLTLLSAGAVGLILALAGGPLPR
jgi:chromate transporter